MSALEPGAHSPEKKDAEELAQKGDIRSLLTLEALELPASTVEQAYRIGRSFIRNGCSEQEAARLLLLGYSARQAAEILALDGFLHGALWITKEYGLSDLSEEAIESGYNTGKSMIGHGYSEQEAARFLLLGLSTRQAAESLAQDGFFDAVVFVSKEYGLHELSESAVDSGYRVGKYKIRHGYSEETAARFLLLSPKKEKYYSQAARDGFLITAYCLKIKCKIDDILPSEVIDALLRLLEKEKFSGFSIIVRSLVDRWDIVKDEVPKITPESMLEEIGGHNAEFSRRFKAIMDKDDEVLFRK